MCQEWNVEFIPNRENDMSDNDEKIAREWGE
jgi:hypothetical protein